jgi:hypothetical protein
MLSNFNDDWPIPEFRWPNDSTGLDARCREHEKENEKLRKEMTVE